ncbi:MAG: DoxX family protein [Acidimicrobiia bacterium]|nr:DoxX family protein [Acidimicrobiia bacterium]
MDTVDIGLLIIRSWVGLVILLHGVNHARGLDGTANWFESIGFRSARLQAINSAVVEIGAGAMLILGLGTSLAAAGIFATMFVAFWTVHRTNGFFIFRPGEGYEYVSTLGLVAVGLAITGPGSASLDSALDIAETLDGWVGALIVGAGLAGAFGLLTIFWKPETTS